MIQLITGFLATLRLFITGRVQFIRQSHTKTLSMKDGSTFSIFRHVVIRTPSHTPPPQAMFMVRFKPADMTSQQNISFSRIPMMIFMGFRGFRSKFWAVNHETGLCQGLYEWQTREDAERYAASIAMRFMSNRSIPESVSYIIVDRADVSFNSTGNTIRVNI